MKYERKIRIVKYWNMHEMRWKKQEKNLHQPGIEPGSVPWQGTILPLDHWCLMQNPSRRFIISKFIFLLFFGITMKDFFRLTIKYSISTIQLEVHRIRDTKYLDYIFFIQTRDIYLIKVNESYLYHYIFLRAITGYQVETT